MRKSHISRDDLLGALRRNGNLNEPEQVRSATLERGGDVSVIKKSKEPQVVEVRAEEGIHTIRIRWE